MYKERVERALKEVLEKDEKYCRVNEETNQKIKDIDQIELTKEEWEIIDTALSAVNARSTFLPVASAKAMQPCAMISVRRERFLRAVDSGFASGRAMIRAGNNDTSVIRSPAIRKAGRLDSYGAVRKPPPDDFPPELSSIFSGVSWTNVRKIITFVEKSPEISFSAAFHYIPHT